ncbi:glycosyltransferase family 1 protein [Clostridium sp. 'White wine YQ']|uniref:glycosyltransferase family 1 protein n=1 Tax=Clostridium sp. 'White wine YQ' TaxID=3027474 RepID=UPI0023670432|nr:glycosyltransferase family 1 protein [Clostridium sp. 'White wine YQ']MDD7792771.1 glycosyltransferase family 1 protein [Clostridium sp. 'White wine YQ']
MKYPIRILHVLGGLNRGGAETMVMNLYRNIDRSKVQFDFIVHTENKCDYDDEIKSLGGKIYSIPRYKGKNHIQYKKVWNSFFEEHPEYKIIHGHVRSTASIYLKIAKRNNLKTIAHSHNTSSGKGLSAFVKNILQYPIRYTADYLFTCSLTAGEWLYGKKACKQKKFHIIKNAINSKQYIFNQEIRDKVRKEFNIENSFVIGHIGRFHLQKNHNYLIEIFKEVHEKEPKAVLMLIGEGELQQKIEKKVNDLGLDNSVIFTGVRSDIPELLQAMDIFVFPSLYEGLGIVVIEAQASGLQCVVSDTVPRETNIANTIEYVSLKDSYRYWGETILKYFDNCKRKNTRDQIMNSGYDIKQTSEWLQNFYIRAWRN